MSTYHISPCIMHTIFRPNFWGKNKDAHYTWVVLISYLYKCFYLFIYFINYFIVIQLQLSAFSPHHSPPTPTAKPTFLPCFHSPPWFCPCVLYNSSWKPSSPLFPPCSPLAIVRLFLISMSLVIFCLPFSFVDYVSVKGEISIMLNEISQAVRDKYHMISPLTGT